VDRLLALLYAGAAQVARAAAQFAPPIGGKLGRSLAARRGIRGYWAAWGDASRDPGRALLWVHAPSVGEGLQARPVLERARRQRPDLQLVYTFFSPSAERFARGLAVDGTGYLPFDTPGDARAMLDALRPRALVFSKLDVWPALTREAAARGVRLGLISATVAPGSGRRSAPARALLRDAYARLDAVGAVDDADAARLVELGARRAVIRVTGDTRYDQVWERAQRADPRGELLAPLASPRPTLVAGSTWPADEAPLLAAWQGVRARAPDARLIIAPHEPSPKHLAPIERWARATGLRPARFGAPEAASADVVVVDRVGVLGELYALASVAYVGGGFHAAGLHSVLEPAAFGAPVVFGPRHEGSRDAGLLLACGGGASAASAGGLTEHLAHWLGNARACESAGRAAREMVRGGLGAADRSTALVLELIGG
jgi:3-deoxy-D-manno-octulosonic-acid transferase